MRRYGSRLQRSPESRSTAIAASLILACLLLILLIARSSGNTERVTSALEEGLAISTSVPVASDQITLSMLESQQDSHTDQQSFQSLTQGQQEVDPLWPPQQEQQQQIVKAKLAPKLQPEVLSAFVSGPAGPLPPGSPEQANFVNGFERLKPLISVTSYAPQAHTATRGIILPAGKAWRLGSAYVALQYLRHTLGCTLPVQIWHTAGEIDDISKLYFEVSVAAQQYISSPALIAVCLPPPYFFKTHSPASCLAPYSLTVCALHLVLLCTTDSYYNTPRGSSKLCVASCTATSLT